MNLNGRNENGGTPPCQIVSFSEYSLADILTTHRCINHQRIILLPHCCTPALLPNLDFWPGRASFLVFLFLPPSGSVPTSTEYQTVHGIRPLLFRFSLGTIRTPYYQHGSPMMLCPGYPHHTPRRSVWDATQSSAAFAIPTLLASEFARLSLALDTDSLTEKPPRLPDLPLSGWLHGLSHPPGHVLGPPMPTTAWLSWVSRESILLGP